MTNRVRLIFVAIGALILSAPVLATQHQMPAPKAPAAAKAIMVTPKKPEFTIELDANPSTGYSWFILPYNNDFIEIEKAHYVAPKTDKVGAAGKFVWQIKVKPDAFHGPHMFGVRFVYTQPWNLKGRKVKRFIVVTHECEMKSTDADGNPIQQWVC